MMDVSALDEDGKPVDWWFIYKVPLLHRSGGAASATGYEYVYYDPTVGKVTRSPHVLTDGKNALDLTLDAVFHGRPAATVGWILYNDEQPESIGKADLSSFGHTKGVIAFDTASKTALWLLHSWPKYFDPAAKEGVMPTPDYGQTYLCVSIDLATASAIAAQMIEHQQPQVYAPRIPSSLPASDALARLARGVDSKAKADSNVISAATRGGQAFKVIAKNRQWGKDFWNDLVGPTLGADMDVETWIRGKIPPTLDSDGVHKTFDVKYIDLSPLGAPWTWPETSDHAKWGISVHSDWVCVGDTIRLMSQEKRGGGTIAIQERALWAALTRTDHIDAPPGHGRAEARALIKATHRAPRRAPADATPAAGPTQRPAAAGRTKRPAAPARTTRARTSRSRRA